MAFHLSPDLEAYVTAVAASTGRSAEELVQEAVTLWEKRRIGQDRYRNPTHTPAQAAARIRELRRGNFLPEGETIEDLISRGRP